MSRQGNATKPAPRKTPRNAANRANLAAMLPRGAVRIRVGVEARYLVRCAAPGCGRYHYPRRRDQLTCSAACRMALSRARRAGVLHGGKTC